MQKTSPMTDEALRQLLLDAKVMAVVGLSANRERASNQVAWYLHHHNYRLFGVNPACPEHTPGVPRDAVAAGARASGSSSASATTRPVP